MLQGRVKEMEDSISELKNFKKEAEVTIALNEQNRISLEQINAVEKVFFLPHIHFLYFLAYTSVAPSHFSGREQYTHSSYIPAR